MVRKKEYPDITINRRRIDRFSDEKILEELKFVAKHFNNQPFTRHDFDAIAKKCKGSTVLSRFGTWKSALSKIGITDKLIKKKWCLVKDEELFREMERIWEIVGQRPSQTEWDSHNPQYAYSTYKNRFHGWINACNKFLGWQKNKTGKEIEKTPVTKLEQKNTNTTHLKNRHIPLKVRLMVLKRDNFKCVLCGASPSSEPSVTLHADHKIPYSEGGDNNLDNIQTLCNKCNWGKGNNNDH